MHKSKISTTREGKRVAWYPGQKLQRFYPPLPPPSRPGRVRGKSGKFLSALADFVERWSRRAPTGSVGADGRSEGSARPHPLPGATRAGAPLRGGDATVARGAGDGPRQ
jgi:hypothetical protein